VFLGGVVGGVWLGFWGGGEKGCFLGFFGGVFLGLFWWCGGVGGGGVVLVFWVVWCFFGFLGGGWFFVWGLGRRGKVIPDCRFGNMVERSSPTMAIP